MFVNSRSDTLSEKKSHLVTRDQKFKLIIINWLAYSFCNQWLRMIIVRLFGLGVGLLTSTVVMLVLPLLAALLQMDLGCVLEHLLLIGINLSVFIKLSSYELHFYCGVCPTWCIVLLWTTYGYLLAMGTYYLG